METISNIELNEQKQEQTTHITLQEKIQKLIDNFTALKEKYSNLKEEYEKTLTSNIELEDDKNQILNEKNHLEQKIIQLQEELETKTEELNKAKNLNEELDSITKVAASKIDILLSQCDID
ncbi:MAG: hypothetical protein PHY08_05615 [Candidatus Cloacimonetes bacterium]|jgi:chromosome segregation ATPase|nr:hypothetical protein [Candidatus Cloacimonadota bacterium]MDD4156034.1 hypothetical protein [Candidatus Cloacimonadota bacterium]